jgi:eukaryotic-like serine/threonine-protein kinase
MSKTALTNRTRLQQSPAPAAEPRTHAAATAAKPSWIGGNAGTSRGFDILQQFDHPLAGRTHDFGDTSNHSIFLALEQLDGCTLTRTLLEHGPLPPHRVAALADHLAGAIDAAHALGILHRGIAPECIVRHLDSAGQEAWKLLDFGLAASPRIDVDDAARDADSAAAALLGSARYASPEAAPSE